MKGGFFTIIAAQIMAPFAYGLSRLAPCKISRPRICAALFMMAAFLSIEILSVEPAMAGIAIAIATGTITAGTDVTGVFGPKNTSLQVYKPRAGDPAAWNRSAPKDPGIATGLGRPPEPKGVG
jgi:hypothetical protein